ncbi:MAG: hypothetical protein ACI8XO_003695 [Verrucomicrobiales bacterium]|jgi:hypothetical protein
MKRLLLFTFSLFCLTFGSCSKQAGSTTAEPTIDFVREIKPILSTNCVICHHSETLLGGLNLETRKTAFGGRPGGAFLVPEEPDSSLIYRVTEDPHGKGALGLDKMPAMKGVSLTPEERGVMRRWIEEGAHWPGGSEGRLEPIKINGAES